MKEEGQGKHLLNKQPQSNQPEDTSSLNKRKRCLKMNLQLSVPSRKCILNQISQNLTSSTDSNRPRQPSFNRSRTDSSGNVYEITQKFFDKYQLLQKMGQGTSGVVYKAMKKDGSGPFAVKQTRCEAEQMLFMKSSYNIIKLLDNQNIIKYKSVYLTCQKNQAFLVMEWFPHPDLSKVKLTQEQIKEIAVKLLEAIQYMHSKGICHRDIKPDNILYDKSTGTIKIIDFGVSRYTGVGKLKKQMLTSTGTLYYKAPELFRGGYYDEMIDEWAAGVTIYKLIAGVTPFESDYYSDTIQNIEKGVLQFKQPIWDQYDPFVKDFLRGLIAPRNKRVDALTAKKQLWLPGNSPHIQSFPQKHLKKQYFNHESSAHYSKGIKCPNKNATNKSLIQQQKSLTGGMQLSEDQFQDSGDQNELNAQIMKKYESQPQKDSKQL